jgi:hypothetical protein
MSPEDPTQRKWMNRMLKGSKGEYKDRTEKKVETEGEGKGSVAKVDGVP